MTYDVRKSIEDALERQAEHEAKCIGLEVRDGRVSLSGIVHSCGSDTLPLRVTQC